MCVIQVHQQENVKAEAIDLVFKLIYSQTKAIAFQLILIGISQVLKTQLFNTIFQSLFYHLLICMSSPDSNVCTKPHSQRTLGIQRVQRPCQSLWERILSYVVSFSQINMHLRAVVSCPTASFDVYGDRSQPCGMMRVMSKKNKCSLK